MSTICGYQGNDGRIWIGADRQTDRGDAIHSLESSKILSAEDKVFAWTGEHCIGGMLEDFIHVLPERDPRGLSQDLRGKLLDLGWKLREDPGSSSDLFVSVLMASGGQLWDLELGTGTAHVVPPFKFEANGSGWKFATGAWHALNGMRAHARTAMEQALQAAIAYDLYSGGDPEVRVIE